MMGFLRVKIHESIHAEHVYTAVYVERRVVIDGPEQMSSHLEDV